MVSLQMIKHIIKGWYFKVFNLKEDIAKSRLEVCNKCPSKIHTKLGYVCEHCGCVLDAKTRVIDEECDLDKW